MADGLRKRYPFLDLGEVNSGYASELEEAALRVIRSGRYIGGEEVVAFEKELATLTGVDHAIGVSNGLDALRLILRGYVEMGVMQPGDEVIVPANTYIASILAVSDAGLTPVPVDARLDSMNIDTSLIEGAVTSRTRGVMTVHLYGRVAWDEQLMEVARRYGLKIIEDCAQAIGARSPLDGLNSSRRVGGLGDAAAFSFYPTKNIGALGDAGAVVSNDAELIRTVKALANYGADRRYHNIYCGWNCRLDALQAALLRVKLKHIDSENADRFERALVYERSITHSAIVKPLMSRWVTDNVWHQYVVRLARGSREEFREELKRRGVETDVHYAEPPHLQPCYAGKLKGYFPVTVQLAREVVSLPIATGTSVKDAAEIAEIINSMKV